MSEHEKRLRDLIGMMRDRYPHDGHEAVKALDALLAEQRATGLDRAITYFTEKQAELDRLRVSARRTNAEVADMKTEAGRCGWAAGELRKLKGRRKKGAKG